MTDILRHPLLTQCYELAGAIEDCGASEELTNATTKCNDLLRALDQFLPEKAPLADRLAEKGFEPVQSISVANLTLERLKRNPIGYTVYFEHDENGLSFTVYDVQDSKHDRVSVAADFKAAANSLMIPEASGPSSLEDSE